MGRLFFRASGDELDAKVALVLASILQREARRS